MPEGESQAACSVGGADHDTPGVGAGPGALLDDPLPGQDRQVAAGAGAATPADPELPQQLGAARTHAHDGPHGEVDALHAA
jgi:hypothetical protein